MTYEIEDGIEIPEKNTGRAKYPWRELEVGQSIFFPTPEGKNLSRFQNGLLASSRRVAAELNRQFTSRQVDGGVRVWRVE